MTAHYIRPLATASMPKRYIYLDTEAHRAPDEFGETQTFRLAVAQIDTYSERQREWQTSPMQRFTDPWSLWEWVDAQTRARKRTVLWTHNVGYDIRISQALSILPALDRPWDFQLIRLDEDLSWAKAVRIEDKASLLFCDLHSWLPTNLEAIGKLIGLGKPELPDEEDTEDIWFERCEADVEILAEAWRHLREWLYEGRHGTWRPTGSAQAWATYRRGYLTHKILIHEHREIRELERLASYTGRAEAFAHGTFRNVSEYDYRHAYAHICLSAKVPTVMLNWSFPRSWSLDKLAARAQEEGVNLLVDAAVRVPGCDIPVLPCRHTDGTGLDRIVWPCGTFRGAWWLEELQRAVSSGRAEMERVFRIVPYRAEPALALWSRWVINQIDGDDPLIALVAKSWARSIVGRFGMRYPSYAEAHTVEGANEIWAGWMFDGEVSSPPRRAMQIGEQVYVAEEGLVEGADTAPQVMSYIMALTRLRLLDAIEHAGHDHVLYCDTDGLIVDERGAANLQSFGPVQDGWLRLKGHYRTLSILGPRQTIKDGVSHVAGIPKAGERQPDGSYAVEWWERTRHALEAGRHDQVRIEHTTMHVSGRDGRRQVRKDSHRTEPIRIG